MLYFKPAGRKGMRKTNEEWRPVCTGKADTKLFADGSKVCQAYAASYADLGFGSLLRTSFRKSGGFI